MEKITSAKNPLIRSLRALGDRKEREKTGRMLVEGEVMLREALSCGLKLHELLCDEEHVAQAAAFDAERAFCVPRELLQSVCPTQTPQGICATFDLPSPAPLLRLGRRIVALDGVQDPGNVGTIWRTADAAGFDALLAGAHCADLLSPKVQRAAMGSGFRLPFLQVPALEDALTALQAEGYRVLASDLSGENFYARQRDGERLVLVIGSEAHGIRPIIREMADERVKLPMRGGAESLNAAIAAAIMMYDIANAPRD